MSQRFSSVSYHEGLLSKDFTLSWFLRAHCVVAQLKAL